MKTHKNISLDLRLFVAAEDFAHRNRINFSALVERSLYELVKGQEKDNEHLLRYEEQARLSRPRRVDQFNPFGNDRIKGRVEKTVSDLPPGVELEDF